MSYYVFSDILIRNENVSLLLAPTCQPLANPNNGINNCSSEDIYPAGQSCTITCDIGYQGSGTVICQDDGIWSGSNMCISE